MQDYYEPYFKLVYITLKGLHNFQQKKTFFLFVPARQGEENIKFAAYLQAPVDDETAFWPAGQQIFFAGTTVNAGGGFDLASNAFVAPIDGAYVFFFTAECIDETVHCHTELRVNGEMVSQFHDDTAEGDVAHQVISLFLF